MANDLTRLHDIHIPVAIGWWPLASGWYLLATTIAIACLIIFLLLRRYCVNGRAKREALRELSEYQRAYQHDKNSPLYSAAISELLKRVALAYYPRTRVAGLRDDAWIKFLNTSVKGVNFNSVRVQLLELPYLPLGNEQKFRPSRLHELQPLFNMARKWIARQGRPCSN